MNRWRSLVLILLLAILGYAGFWYAKAYSIRKDLPARFLAYADHGYDVRADRVDVSGFPYRLEVTISGLTAKSRLSDVAASIGSMTLTSHLWTPDHWVISANDLSANLPHLGATSLDIIDASWRFFPQSGERLVIVPREGQKLTTAGKTLELESIGIAIANLDDGATRPEGLYEGARARLGFGFKLDGTRWRIEADWSGEPILDWSQPALEAWRDSAGVFAAHKIWIEDAGGTTKASGTISLDEELRILATFNTAEEADATLNTGQATGLTNLLSALRADDGTDPSKALIVTVQNGVIMVNGSYLGDISPVIELEPLAYATPPKGHQVILKSQRGPSFQKRFDRRTQSDDSDQ